MHNIKGIVTTHAIVVRDLSNGTISIKFKAWHSLKDNWVGDAQNPSEWLHIMTSFPSGAPPIISPSSLDLFCTLNSILALLPTDISPEVKHKWEFFFQNVVLHTKFYEPQPQNLWTLNQVYIFFFIF